MKKTLTINLANTVYHIDEDAYQILQTYFEKLKAHFSTEQDVDEIMADIEARFSELFNERLRYGMQVITQKEVQETIGIMGNPSDFESSPEEKGTTPQDNNDDTKDQPENTPRRKSKRLYRDIENAYLGGVAAGISQYLNIDVVFVRLFFVLLILLGYGSPFIVYIILWIVIPEARTSAQKLEMRGEEPTIENIKKFVKDNVERVAEKAEKELHKARTRNFFQKAGDGLVEITKAGAKVIMALIGGIFGLLGIAVLLMLIAAITFTIPFLFTGISSPFSPFGTDIYIEGYNLGNLSMYPQLLVSILLFIGIPLGTIAYAIFQKIFNWKKTSTTAGWLLVIIWLISFIFTLYYGINYANEIFTLNSSIL